MVFCYYANLMWEEGRIRRTLRGPFLNFIHFSALYGSLYVKFCIRLGHSPLFLIMNLFISLFPYFLLLNYCRPLLRLISHLFLHNIIKRATLQKKLHLSKTTYFLKDLVVCSVPNIPMNKWSHISSSMSVQGTFVSQKLFAKVIEAPAIALQELGMMIERDAGVFWIPRHVNYLRLLFSGSDLSRQKIERLVALDESRPGLVRAVFHAICHPHRHSQIRIA